MSYIYNTAPRIQFFNPTSHTFLAGGLIYITAAGTSTPILTYPTIEDALNLTNPNTNPIVLDSQGSAAFVILSPVKIVVTYNDADGNTHTLGTFDNISPQNIILADTNNKIILEFSGFPKGVNYVTTTNGIIHPITSYSANVGLASAGVQDNIDLNLQSKGSSSVVNLNNGIIADNNPASINSIELTTVANLPFYYPCIQPTGPADNIDLQVEAKGAGTIIAKNQNISSQTGGKGKTNGALNTTGRVGELLTSSASGTTSSTTQNLNSIALGAGRWDVLGFVTVTTGGSANATTSFSLGTTSGSLNALHTVGMPTTASATYCFYMGKFRQNTSGSNTVYLVGSISNTGTAFTSYLSARRTG